MESFNVFVILLLVSQHALCVEVCEGEESVVLPCSHGVSQADGVVWTRSSFSVHARKKGEDDLGQQDQQYMNRTSMREDAPQGGDLSLTLTTPSVSDSGDYTCTARSKGQDRNYTVVTLVVTRALNVTAPVETESSSVWVKILVPLGVIALAIGLAIGLAVAIYWCNKRKGRHESHNQLNLAPLSPSVLKVESGAESVLLPFRTTADLSGDVKVEWMGGGDMKVHVYENMSDQPGEQHKDYRGRTQMSEDALRTGVLSLTLRLPKVTDSKVYSCTLRRDGDELEERQQVELQVTVPKVEVESGAESVLLPFRTTADLPENSSLKWLIEEPFKKVHVFDTDHDVPGEQHEDYRGRTQMSEGSLGTRVLSLTLRRPTVADSNTYTCRVYNQDQQFLREKTVQLEVKDRILVEDETINNRRSSSIDPTPLMADQSDQ